MLRFSEKRSFEMCSSSQTTHSSVLQEHLLEGNEVNECQQQVKDVTWHLLFGFPADGRDTYCPVNLITFQCTSVPPSGLWQNNICYTHQVYRTNNCMSWWVALKTARIKWPSSCDVTSHVSRSMKVFMLKPGILSISCCSRCFSSRSTYTTAMSIIINLTIISLPDYYRQRVENLNLRQSCRLKW